MSNDTPVFIEFDKNERPFEAWTEDYPGYYSTYDIEYSKAYGGLLANNSGGGPFVPTPAPGTAFWAKEGLVVEDKAGSIRLNELPPEYQGDIWTWADDGYTVYCAICDDQLPTDDTNEPCEHVRWCDECEDWSTPDEPCEHDKAAREQL